MHFSHHCTKVGVDFEDGIDSSRVEKKEQDEVPKERITTREIAEMLGVSRQAIYKMVIYRRIPEPVRNRGRSGNYWPKTKNLVYILKALKYNKTAGNVSQTRSRRSGK